MPLPFQTIYYFVCMQRIVVFPAMIHYNIPFSCSNNIRHVRKFSLDLTKYIAEWEQNWSSCLYIARWSDENKTTAALLYAVQFVSFSSVTIEDTPEIFSYYLWDPYPYYVAIVCHPKHRFSNSGVPHAAHQVLVAIHPPPIRTSSKRQALHQPNDRRFPHGSKWIIWENISHQFVADCYRSSTLYDSLWHTFTIRL